MVKKPAVVVLGAGYGGLMATVKLQKLLHPNEADIVLVNKTITTMKRRGCMKHPPARCITTGSATASATWSTRTG